MTDARTIPAWLHLSPDTTPAGVVVQAVDKATGGHEDDATIARYVVEALTASGHLAAGEPVVEYAQGYKSGAMLVRYVDERIERMWPTAEWVVDQQQHGGQVHRRTVIVVEDWAEVPRG